MFASSAARSCGVRSVVTLSIFVSFVRDAFEGTSSGIGDRQPQLVDHTRAGVPAAGVRRGRTACAVRPLRGVRDVLVDRLVGLDLVDTADDSAADVHGVGGLVVGLSDRGPNHGAGPTTPGGRWRCRRGRLEVGSAVGPGGTAGEDRPLLVRAAWYQAAGTLPLFGELAEDRLQLGAPNRFAPGWPTPVTGVRPRHL